MSIAAKTGCEKKLLLTDRNNDDHDKSTSKNSSIIESWQKVERAGGVGIGLYSI